MHAVLITFSTTATDNELAAPMAQFAEQIRDIPGFLSKTWLHDAATRGGFYLFTDDAAARAYVHGPVVASIHANPAFTGVQVRTFGVHADLSARTGTRAATPARPQPHRQPLRRPPGSLQQPGAGHRLQSGNPR